MTPNNILDFVKKHNLAVVSTVNEAGKPQAAVVEFCEQDDLTIIIDTLKTSRKYKNLQTNSNVAVVIGWDNNITVQIDAKAKELTGPKLEQAKKAYFTKNPRAKKWGNKPEIAYFAFKPEWIRYSDLGQHPWLVKEFKLKKFKIEKL